eukprot:m.80628 g.80628  ORF g.80628 m.80628 type:complete len:392 (-) comp16300_c0_seq1:272-1447(-)
MDAPVNDKGGDAARKGKLVVAITAFALGAIFVFGVNNAPALIYGQNDAEPEDVVITSLRSVAETEEKEEPIHEIEAIARNITRETVKVAEIFKGEKIRTKLGKVQTPARKSGDAPLADKEFSRSYDYEEMFIGHPDLFTINSKVKELTIQKRVKSVYVGHAIPAENKKKPTLPPVLLLHGSQFSSATWEGKTHTVDALVNAGYHVYMVDLPGYGRSEGRVDTPLQELFLEGLIAKLKLFLPFIVAPSMSGNYAVPYVTKYPRKVSGFVPVAATALKKTPLSVWQTTANITKILYIYGEKDTQIGAPSAKYFATVKNIEVLQIPQGTHPCYLDNPKMFNKNLVKFLTSGTRKYMRKMEKKQARNLEMARGTTAPQAASTKSAKTKQKKQKKM